MYKASVGKENVFFMEFVLKKRENISTTFKEALLDDIHFWSESIRLNCEQFIAHSHFIKPFLQCILYYCPVLCVCKNTFVWQFFQLQEGKEWQNILDNTKFYTTTCK